MPQAPDTRWGGMRAQAVTVDVALRGFEDVQMTADIKELRDTALEAVNELGEPEQATPNRRRYARRAALPTRSLRIR